ncbi:phospholipid-translocating p-type flippase subfamily protein [Cystoisospora suis]|uniref:Phospholipid-translocating p-type flippase subfamily protein n=1 Tax=Cystoisospora suis TaxID=483139 RepID=A0A2C6KJ68_9APIC|nr:phospholipid-translocating p-type flippase subfamily protein [Cystoisospora suis]
MIQSADVGVGLKGEEGMQAFNSADYGLVQFRFLQPLLLAHGRWNYRRVSKLVLYMFYKNLVLVLPLFFYGLISLFSGQKFYYEFLYQMYNVVFTAIPITLYGVLDQDVDKKLSLKYPQLYRCGQMDLYLNLKVFLKWAANGVWHAVVIFAIPTLGFAFFAIPTTTGRPLDIWMIGLLMFIMNMIVVNIKVLLESYYITSIIWGGFAVSLLACLLFVFLFSSWPGFAGSFLGCFFYLISDGAALTFLSTMAVSTLCLTRDWLWKAWRVNCHPQLYHLIQQREYMGNLTGWPKTPDRGACDIELEDEDDAYVPNKSELTTGESKASRLGFGGLSLPGSGGPRGSLSFQNEVDEFGIPVPPHRQQSVRGFAFSEADPALSKLLRERQQHPPHSSLLDRGETGRGSSRAASSISSNFADWLNSMRSGRQSRKNKKKNNEKEEKDEGKSLSPSQQEGRGGGDRLQVDAGSMYSGESGSGLLPAETGRWRSEGDYSGDGSRGEDTRSRGRVNRAREEEDDDEDTFGDDDEDVEVNNFNYDDFNDTDDEETYNERVRQSKERPLDSAGEDSY